LRQHAGKDIDSMLHNDSFIHDEKSKQEKILLMLIIKSSLRQLDQKWDLTRQKRIKNQKFQELLDLVIDGVMSKEMVIELFMGGDVADIAMLLNKRQNHLNADKPYQFITTHSQSISVIADLSAWFQQAMKTTVPNLHQDLTYFSLTSKSDKDFKNTLLQLWLKGVDIKWALLYPEGTFNKLPLPTYCFDQASFWLRSENQLELIRRKQFTISPHDPMIRDHIITGKPMLPGACMIDFGLSTLNRSVTLHNIVIKNPAIIEAQINLEVEIYPQEKKFILKTETLELCEAEYEHKTNQSFPSIDLDSILSEQAQKTEVLYESLSRLGYQYGKSLQVIKNLWQSEKKWLFELKGHEKGQKNPALIDGLFQTVLIVEYLLAGQAPKENTLHVPYIIKSFNISSELTEHCFVCIEKQDIQTKGGDFYAQLQVYNAAGKGILQIQGMVFKQVSTQFLLKETAKQSKKVYFYQPTWIKQTLSPQNREFGKRHAIIFDNLLATRTIIDITQHYQKSFIINKGSTFLRKESGTFEINATAEEDYTKLIQEIFAQINKGYDIYYLWAYTPDAHFDEQTQGIQSFFLLVKALTRFKPKLAINILIATHKSLIVTDQDKGEGYGYGSLFGLAQTVMLENPSITIKMVDFAQENPAASLLLNAIKLDLAVSGMERSGFPETGDYVSGMERSGFPPVGNLTDKNQSVVLNLMALSLLLDENISKAFLPRIAYRDQVRYVQAIERVSLPQKMPPLKDNGVYLLIGGLGGIGFQVAEFISQQVKARLILVGSTELNEEKQQQITQLQNTGNEILYLQVDVANLAQMKKAIISIKQQYAVINGVIQASGVLEDKLLINKDWKSFERVLAPKVQGTFLLNQLTQNEPLDFFVVFSSIVAVTGNIGQVDYATANSFLDTFIHYRSRNNYPGKSLSINWTLWADGGMGQNPSVIEAFSKNAGIISSQAGLNAFAQLLGARQSQYIVAGREPFNLPKHPKDKKVTKELEQNNLLIDCHFDVRRNLKVSKDFSLRRNDKQGNYFVPSPKEKNNINQIENELIHFLSKIIEVPPSDLDTNTDLREYGLDSISLTDYADKINQHFDISINPTLFYEFPNIQALSKHLVERYGLKSTTVQETEEIAEPAVMSTPPIEPRQAVKPFVADFQDIAIIGMSGRFPGAKNLAQFWDNLTKEKDSISEIPSARWDWRSYFGDPQGDENKTNSKWGGFLDNVKSFDPAFFHISNREAELMDPQQRLLLEEVWHVIEDAGYNPESLSGTKTGIFIGVCNNDYNDLLLENNIRQDAYTSTGSYFSIIPNRISYFLDVHGPSVAIDTACSSSLVALHQAVQALAHKDCTNAIAGGVNLCLTPKRYCSFSHAGMLSPDGRCKTFDKSANGYVRGEGVGVVLLKPLNKAVADGDHIYGVIKGSAVNHGGFSNSLTAPNPNAQAALLVSAYQKANISPETVTYIEAHGTGTSLGDPIEINGLKKAFEQLYKQWDKPTLAHCGIGSVKTNIGHLESAAGIAGVIKVLLAMKHHQLPASINFKELNPYIQLQDSPFFIVNQTQSWESLKGGDNQRIPRRAGVSSFGFGGANAHIVLEEYLNPTPSSLLEQSPQLIVLSAKNADRLIAYVKEIVAFLDSTNHLSLADIAYTLQVGRLAMEERLAMIVSSLNDLKEKLTQYTQGQNEIEECYSGNVNKKKAQTDLLIDGKSGAAFLKVAVEEQEFTKLAQLWVSGIDIDWQLLYPNHKPQRISLPTYPFAKERYWIPTSAQSLKILDVKEHKVHLHPLLDSNESTLEEQCFKKVFFGEEFYLTDHQVGEQNVLPAVVYLEMALAAGNLANRKSSVKKLTNLVWAKPITVSNRPVPVHISLYPDRQQVEFEVITMDENGERQVHAQGKLNYGSPAASETLDIFAIQNRCVETWDGAKCYQLFQTTGLNYGPSFQTIQALYRNDSEALSRLFVPQPLTDDFNDFVLHPSLMDGALQTVIGLMGQSTESTPYLPFALNEIELINPLTETCYAYAKWEGGNGGLKKFDIQLLDEAGQMQVHMKDFSVKPLQKYPRITKDDELMELLNKLAAGKLTAKKAKKYSIILN
jgi:acyl transferase domain-containing protein/acyl carrier protein